MENWIYDGITALISGLTSVFVVLILISFIISLFKYINFGKNKEITRKDTRLHLQAVVEENVIEPNDELELVAVITAAIAASLNTTTDRLQVKSLRRIQTSNTGWKRR